MTTTAKLTVLQERVLRALLSVMFVLTVYGANWSISTLGFVPVGFGLVAPAGVYFAGLGFTIRDLLHDAGGRRWVIGAIVAGALLSAGISGGGRIAVASGVAFLLSEAADLLIYQPLRRRGWLRAVAASNVVGLVVDSVLFLSIAFGSLSFAKGQIVGKAWMTLVAVMILWGVRRALSQRDHPPRTVAPVVGVDGDA